jgi:hypothetical protein
MRSVNKGNPPLTETDTPVVFAQYQAAALYLKERLGRYCSYCERTVPVGLAVEHKLPKKHHAHLELEWHNFLLACANCNSSKGSELFSADSVFWPDEHDTFSLIAYLPSGAVRPLVGLDGGIENRVIATLALFGLSKTPDQMTSADHRYFDRLEVWQLAEQSRADLLVRDTAELRRAIVRTAKTSGGYSIWQAVFSADRPMQLEIANAFPGTNAPHLLASTEVQ